MRVWVYILSFFIAFAPVYSHAFVPFAIFANVAGRVVIPTATGAVIKKLSPQAIVNLFKNGLATCIKNGVGCGAVISAMKGDGINISVDIDSNTTNNDIAVEIYRDTKGCSPRTRWEYQRFVGWQQHGGYEYANTLEEALSIIETSAKQHIGQGGELTRSGINKKKQNLQDELNRTFDKPKGWEDVNSNTWDDYYVLGSTMARISIRPQYRVVCGNGKTPVSDEEIASYIKEYATKDDITNIYNYDYSKHNNITVNNRTEKGSDINNIKNNFDKNEKDKIVSKEAADKIKKKKKDYDIDDINDKNCDKNDKGEYDKCGADREKKDKDKDDEPKDDEKDKDDKKDKDKDDDKPKIDCKASSFHRKVCDWIDWTQGKYQEDKDTKIDIKDGSADFELNKNRIQFTAQCPPPKKINIHFNQINVNYEISYQGLCDAFITLKPFLLGLSGIHSAMIIAGRRD